MNTHLSKNNNYYYYKNYHLPDITMIVFIHPFIYIPFQLMLRSTNDEKATKATLYLIREIF